MAQRILLCVEPDDATFSVIRRALEPHGFDITNIPNGEQAIDWAKKAAPTLIIVSVEPRKVGYAICNKIKRSNELKDIPLILTSSEETPQTFEQHKKLKSRANEYLIKPFSGQDLVAKVSQVVPMSDVPVNSEEILLEDEISIADADIVEEEKPDDESPGTGRHAQSELDAIFDQETDAAFAALQAAEGDAAPAGERMTERSSGTPSGGALPWKDDPEGWEAEATRATAFQELEAAVPTKAQLPDEDSLFPSFPSSPEPSTPPPAAVSLSPFDGAAPESATSVSDTGERPAWSPFDVAPSDTSDVAPAVFDAAPDGPPVPDEGVPLADEVEPVPAEHSGAARISPVVEAGRVAELEARVRDLEADRERLQSENYELRERRESVAAFSKDKEVLTLREIINKKEKDILDLRDALDAKERQILDHKDRIRENERARRDLDERTLGIEKQLMGANERIVALQQDKDKGLERERALKARLDDAHGEISKAHDEVEQLKKRLVSTEEKSRSELDRTRGELESRIAEAEEAHRNEVTRLTEERAAAESSMLAEHEAELSQQKSEYEATLEAERKRAAEELAGLGDRTSAELSRLRKEHEKAIASLKEEQAVQIAAERQAHQAAQEAKERDHKNEILGMRRRHEEELRAADERRQKDLGDAEGRRVADLEAAENRRRSELQQRDEEHHALVAEMDRRHFAEKSEMSERHRSDLDQAHGRAARAEGELAARTEELSAAHRRIAGLEADLDSSRADLRDREVKLAQSNARIAELEGKTAEHEEQIMRAFQKMRNDDRAIEKAKRALAVALSLLEDRSGTAGGQAGAAKAVEGGTT